MIFYLTTHEPSWLWDGRADFPLFVSRRRLARLKTLHRAVVPWALDSGGFTELSSYGRWTISPHQYVAEVARYAHEIGTMQWAAPTDWMCEPAIIHGGQVGRQHFPGTGLSVDRHQALTTENYLQLCELWPAQSSLPCPFIPVLQGWSAGEYERHCERYAAAGVNLATAPTVGLGSVCRRQNTVSIGIITSWLASEGLRLHGFGVKTQGLSMYSVDLVSADSLAWSYDGRRNPPLPGHRHLNCANCVEYAAMWRDSMLASAGLAEAA
jgi:hypothetical protein